MGKNRSTSVELTNVCVLCQGDKILVEDKVGAGIVFPGGHVESGETFKEAVIREMQEETGLTILNPVLRGIKSWCGEDGQRYLVTIYRADAHIGSLRPSCEGKVFWVTREEFVSMNPIWGMDIVLQICDNEGSALNEMFWHNQNEEWTVV